MILVSIYWRFIPNFSLNTSITEDSMNCHKISEPHVWRYSKHTKMRRCLKCKSRLQMTEKEYHLKWGMHKITTK
ncbi:hypothetical protein C5F47_02135 [Nitrosopumilus cobalaminigenes]|uniref:Uncharacterized protein n=1 Tax=Nitrosopumilus cobalaminigenes TaxID=1470066 RepID=A0A7D5RB90_9ARCH|nr:hypothetical protein C5F47_02135 [Nitrosopumilus cobalaminigenes]